MIKHGGFFYDALIVLLLIALGIGGYYLYQSLPIEKISFNNFNLEENTSINNVLSKQFYPRMRYQDRIINYHISESCPVQKAELIKEAFRVIESRTVLSFNSVPRPNSVLSILCSDISPEAGQENYFVAGEGGPSRVIDSTLYSVILEGKIALYRDGQCDNANVAVHELLHALGFDHNNNPKSILYPTLKCDQKIDSEIIESVNKLYEDDSLPDLIFSAANANKNGRYLNFHIEVLNQGLQSSQAVKISVYADGRFIENFELGEISIGTKKILDVQNLRIPSSAESIGFMVDEENKITEIYKNNNKITLNAV